MRLFLNTTRPGLEHVHFALRLDFFAYDFRINAKKIYYLCMASEDWSIIYYESPSGGIPVYDFIESLSPTAKSKVSNTLDLLTKYGIKLGLPHVKKVTGTDLWELRILGRDNIRIFYIATFGKVFLLLHGFIKKSQKAPEKEIKISLVRLNEYKLRKS